MRVTWACVHRAGDLGAVTRVGARVAVGAAGLRRALVDLRGDCGLRAPQGRARAGAPGAAGAGQLLGQGLRRHGEVPLDYCDSLSPGFVAVLKAQCQAQGRVQQQLILGKCVQELWQDYKAKYGQ
ncbi:hypothetical protein EJB05_23944, partial [Eragrostis curvula]